jgi:hypothetical protein
MATNQQFLPYDCSTIANQITVAQGIEAGLAAIGLVKVQDPGTVIWANATKLSQVFQVSTQVPLPQIHSFQGPWAGGTSYVGSIASANAGTCSVVTSGGVTYLCISPSQYSGLTNVVQNTNLSGTATAVAASLSGGTAVYTIALAGGTANGLVGYQFVCTGGTTAANNGTFACVASSATNVTLANAAATLQSAGTFPTLTASSSVCGFVFIGATTTPYASWLANSMVGLSLISTGFVASSGQNNTTFTVTSSGVLSGTSAVLCCTFAGVTETHSGTVTLNTAPASDPMINVVTTGPTNTPAGRWIPYYYDIFRSNDKQNPTNPITSVSVSGSVTTYNGSGFNYVAGEAVTIAGFVTNPTNNGTFTIQTSSPTSFTVATVAQVNETHSATVYDCDNPIYMRLVYYTGNQLTNTGPGINLSIGTLLGTATGTGSILYGGNVWNNAANPPEVHFLSPAVPSFQYECDFSSSDAGSFCMLLFRDPAGPNSGAKGQTVVCDRARDNNGNALDIYWNVFAVSSSVSPLFQILYKLGVGGVVPSSGATKFLPSIAAGNNSWEANALVPAKPIFPMPGYIANPMLGAVIMSITDCAEGMFVNVVLYSVTHTYLITKNNGNPLVCSEAGLGQADALGIRWE